MGISSFFVAYFIYPMNITNKDNYSHSIVAGGLLEMS